MPSRIIPIHPQAPSKPPAGQACNGCGVCCLYEPCPLGMLLSGRRHGACRVLRWEAGQSQYRCGVLLAPGQTARAALPGVLTGLAPVLGAVLRRLGSRWIAAGRGCDSTLEVEPRRPAPESDRQSAP